MTIKTNILVLAVLVSWMSTAEALPLPDLLHTPLITGASVSADHKAPSPGRTLSLRYTQESALKTVAVNGTPGIIVWKKVTDNDLMDRSIIMGLDLFFWDSVIPKAERSARMVQEVIDSAASRNIPLVLGDIPELKPGMQFSRDMLNGVIRQKCRQEAGCYILPFDALHQQIVRDGYLEIGGVKYTMSELIPDGLHLSPIASTYLADVLEQELAAAL